MGNFYLMSKSRHWAIEDQWKAEREKEAQRQNATPEPSVKHPPEAAESATTTTTTQALKAEGAPTWEFDVAISFAGPQRAIAEALADLARLRGIRVFYDMNHAAELWGEDLTTRLDSIYREKARFCVALVSRAYAEREWPRHELRSARARAVKEQSAYILPLCVEEGVMLEGVPATIGYISLSNYTVEQVVEILLQKLGVER